MKPTTVTKNKIKKKLKRQEKKIKKEKQYQILQGLQIYSALSSQFRVEHSNKYVCHHLDPRGLLPWSWRFKG